MLSALLGFPRKIRKQKAREWARRSHVARMANAAAAGPDFEAIIWRAKQDARGEVLHHGMTYSAANPDGTPWAIVRSKIGRTNQVDVHVGQKLAKTCGLRTVKRGMKRAKLGHVGG